MRYIQCPSQQQSLKRNVTAVVELAIYLHYKFGHIAKVCNSQEATGEKQQRNYSSRPRQQQHSQQHSRHSYPQQTRHVDTETPCDATQDSSEWGHSIFTVQSTTQPSIKVDLKVNNVEVVMELDTGTSLTIMSEKTLKHKLPHLELQPSAVILKRYSGEQLTVLGQAQVKVAYKNQEIEAPLIVAGDGPTLFGRKLAPIASTGLERDQIYDYSH